MSRWYVLLDAPQSDLVQVKRQFPNSGFIFEEIDGKGALSAPQFEQCKDRSDVIDAGMTLLSSINVALRLSVFQYNGLLFHGLVEKRSDGTLHRTMLASSAIFGVSGVAAVGIGGSIGRPLRTKEERLLSLLAKSPEMTDLAIAMTARPLTWGSMNLVYESAKGLMSAKASNEAKRADYGALIDRGWITADQSLSFYKSAAYHRHGYPKIDKNLPRMEYDEASILISKLFWHLVDAMEPL
jgi:hypothetical protein